jgi:hypothetical protein
MEETFSKNLDDLMLMRRVPNAEVAKALEVSQKQVSLWRHGARPKPGNIAALAKFFKVSEQALLYGVAMAAPAILSPVQPRTERRKDLMQYQYWNEFAEGRYEVCPYVTAAGSSRECELAENPIYTDRPLKSYQQYFMIHGESMVDTLHDGDVVVVRDLGPNGIVLPPLSKQKSRTPLPRMKQFIPDLSVCILSIDSSDITCKRIRYDGNDHNWHLLVVADNTTTPGFPTVVKRETEITFWAVVEGVALKAKE